jgi:DNA repair photolyase
MEEDGHPLELIEFRLTIGTYQDQIREFWEPNAPSISERIACVKLLNQHNIKTSISCEPLLDSNNENGEVLILDWLLQHAENKEIWVGAMQYTKNPPILDYDLIYAKYKDIPQIKWKESFRKHLNVSNPEIGQKPDPPKKDLDWFLVNCEAPANLTDVLLEEIDVNSKKNCEGRI